VESLLLKDKTESRGELTEIKRLVANELLTPLHLKKIKSEHHLTQCLLAATQMYSLDTKECKRLTSGEALTITASSSAY